MADDSVACPHCGAMSRDHDWCDVCGGELGVAEGSDQPWLEVGHALSFELDGAARMARVIDLLDVYATRRILFARLCPMGEEARFFTDRERAGSQVDEGEARDEEPDTGEFPKHSDAWMLLMIEESSESHALEPDVLRDEIRDLVHLPLAVKGRGKRRYAEIYEAPSGLPLQDHLESLGRLLTLKEAAQLTNLLMDAVERLHDAGLYHFQICPWTLHLSRKGGPESLDAQTPFEEMALAFEGIRGFYDAKAPVESHPVILGFSPPEFFGRAPGPLDHRADIFGVGMLFYYLLSGASPPTGALTQHVPCLSLRAFRYELAPGVQRFVDGATARDPNERFKDIKEARAALARGVELVEARTLTREDLDKPGEVSLFCAVDTHIGIGKGRRTPINQDSVFLGQDVDRGLSLIAVGDGVSTASFGSGDVASKLLIEACSKAWIKRAEAFPSKGQTPPDPEPTSPNQLLSRNSAKGADTQIKLSQALSMDETLDVDLSAVVAAVDDGSERSLIEAIASTLDAESLDISSEVEIDSPTEDPEDEELNKLIEAQPHGRLSLVGHRAGAPTLTSPAARLITRVLQEGNSAISSHINARFSPFHGPVHEVMGTTALAAVIHGDQFTLASLGDSRVYLLSEGHLECLTRDHNLASMRIIEGFPADECLSLPQGAALARCLGTFEIHDGELKATHPEPDLMTFRLLPGDTILMTTDGLIDFAGPNEDVSERNVKAVLQAEEIPALACLRLILLANEGGGEDNIGVAVLRVTEHHPGQRGVLVQSFPPVEGLDRM